MSGDGIQRHNTNACFNTSEAAAVLDGMFRPWASSLAESRLRLDLVRLNIGACTDCVDHPRAIDCGSPENLLRADSASVSAVRGRIKIRYLTKGHPAHAFSVVTSGSRSRSAYMYSLYWLLPFRNGHRVLERAAYRDVSGTRSP